MKILVANLGSTSFKYRLFDMADERQMVRGGVERIGVGGESLRGGDRRPTHPVDGACARTTRWRFANVWTS